MIGCLRTHVRNQPIIALYFESENELKFYNLEEGFEAIKLEYSLRLKIKCNDWLLYLRFILSLRINSSLITSRPGIQRKVQVCMCIQ